MLVIERSQTEYLAIGPHIRVFVDRIVLHHLRPLVRLGICAPPSIGLIRGEFFDLARARGNVAGLLAMSAMSPWSIVPARRTWFRAVIRRRAGQAIRIGDDVEIRVVAISRRQSQLGIAAPRSVTVLRGELFERERAGAMSRPGSAREAPLAAIA
jgi:carbon storage regulator